MIRQNNKPELLSPAGSPEALRAAVAGGADAVYFGVGVFNARMNAQNFGGDALSKAISYCHRMGVRVFITLNTLLYGKEMREAVKTAVELRNLGADAFIVADIGLADCLHRLYPEMELHASTQMSGENICSAGVLKNIGFSRMVAPRELPREDIETLCKNSPIETEIFIHGALCVCHSGQCLLSSVIGGRSGNRGRCAQPCRLPYRATGSEYPLSLKDLCLAGHISDIIKMHPASLKIEGRMKSPDYVYGVTKIYRRLLDEERDATPEEQKELARLFSRSGFTDGYWTKKIDRTMLGVRTEDDKTVSRAAETKTDYTALRKIPIALYADFSGDVPILTATLSHRGRNVTETVKGGTPDGNYPVLDPARLSQNLQKWGSTVYSVESLTVTGEERAAFPLSAVNGLRRALAEALDRTLEGWCEPLPLRAMPEEKRTDFQSRKEKSAFFVRPQDLTPLALSFFDRIFVPLMRYSEKEAANEKIGIAFPPVAFDSELSAIEEAVKKAVSLGCRAALITNLWQTELARKYNLTMHGDLRLGICNAKAASAVSRLGFASLISSSEAGTAPIACPIPLGTLIYGRLPVMTLEKCVIRETVSERLPKRSACRYCEAHPFTALTDRTGTSFPITREFAHRNVMYNSVPTYMADKTNELRADFFHCIFTDEGSGTDDIIRRLQKGEPPEGRFRRLTSPE